MIVPLDTMIEILFLSASDFDIFDIEYETGIDYRVIADCIVDYNRDRKHYTDMFRRLLSNTSIMA